MSLPGNDPAFLFEDRQTPGDWHVQWTDDEGGFEMAMFSGPRARTGGHLRGAVLRPLRRGPYQRRCVGRKEMAARGLYKEPDGSWRQADGDKGAGLIYRLKKRERWTLLDRDRAMVVRPTRPPKIVYSDGRVEEIAPKTDA